MVSDAEAAPPALQEAVADLCRSVGLAELYVFGSRSDEFAAAVRGSSAERLGQRGILESEATATFVRVAGYRNRLVHFYDRVSEAELYEICSQRLTDFEDVLAAIHRWIHANPKLLEPGV
jgi:hypothetical protein